MAQQASTQPGQSTNQFAYEHGVQAQSVRHQYCLRGHYFGCVPTKLKNGRLSWQPDPSLPNATQTAGKESPGNGANDGGRHHGQ